MNRRAIAWVGAVVLVIIALTWWLTPEEPLAAEPTRVVEPIALPASSVMPPLPSLEPNPPVLEVPPTVAIVDAGWAEVEIEVVENGVRQVGTRVEIDGPGGRAGRPTDVMGFARFTLQEGPWRVTQPARRGVSVSYDGGSRADFAAASLLARTTPFEVRAPLTHLRLEVPRALIIRGRVLDLKGRPVAGAEVSDQVNALTVSDALGQYTLEVTGEKVSVQARLGSSRSILKSVTAPGERDLVLEPWTLLRVEALTGSKPRLARLLVLQHSVVVATGVSETSLWVPMGPLEILARRNAKGGVLTGKSTVTASEVTDIVQVFLAPSPPISGRLVDLAGTPLAGVTLEATELRPEVPGGVVARLGGGVATTTSPRGEFALAPALGDSADPVYLLTITGGLWKTTRKVMVRIDDGPLEVTAEPTPRPDLSQR